MDSIQAIIQAAATLSNIEDADKESLLSHREELESAYQHLKALLQCSPATHASAPQETSAFDAPNTQAAASSPLGTLTSEPSGTQPAAPEDVARKKTEEFMKSLDSHQEEIKEFLDNIKEPVLLSSTDWTLEDPYIVDISFTDKNAPPLVKFRSLLGAIGLADEYIVWERADLQKTKGKRKKRINARLDALCDDLSSGNKKSSCFERYVRENPDKFDNKEMAKRYTEFGLKYRVFGKIYSSLARVHSDVTEPGTHYGVLGLLFLSKELFRRLKYAYMPQLANAILVSKWAEVADAKDECISSCLKANYGN
ncbi:hypothetical protein EYZ11_006932 [Aspergillus tanneri]|uniref:Uncharacterized protein n=1 Tax=Aspergillus tanneri TaxID=1220188 RepID=A0A4S3JE72_9EURO|nr:hypothetical protein EYZ11_006932 [Aspergillus tanneri]